MDRQHFQYPSPGLYETGEKGPGGYQELTREVRPQPCPRSLSQHQHFLSFQLENIQNHIKLTKEHLDALNMTFAGNQNPPPIFISEYEEYTQKLHNFTLRETSLKEKLSDISCVIYNGGGEVERM